MKIDKKCYDFVATEKDGQEVVVEELTWVTRWIIMVLQVLMEVKVKARMRLFCCFLSLCLYRRQSFDLDVEKKLITLTVKLIWVEGLDPRYCSYFHCY